MHDAIHYLVIDGVPSTDFGVYCTNAGAFAVPKKDVDLKAVNGRNGAVYLDYGRWDNVTIKYDAFIYEDFQTNFDGFIAFLMSRSGYFRLEDTVRDDIFREAVFTGDISVKVQPEGQQGTFEISFSCKPQKFLKSGELPIHNPFSIENPTRFPSHPLIQIYGYGYLGINAYSIEIADKTIGELHLAELVYNGTSEALTTEFVTSNFNQGDSATVSASINAYFKIVGAVPGTISLTRYSQDSGLVIPALTVNTSGEIMVKVTAANYPFSAGVTGTVTKSVTIKVSYTNSSNVEMDDNVTIDFTLSFLADGITISDMTITSAADITKTGEYKSVGSAFVTSTVSSLGNPLYLDMETGDAYKYENDELIYVNSAVSTGDVLATLDQGTTWFMYDNETMPNIYVIPRWWTI